MKIYSPSQHLVPITMVTSLLLISQASAVLYVSNFTSVSSSTASGVWRNNDTATDSAIPVSLSQVGGTILTAGGSQSVINDATPWLDPGFNLFEPNFIGDSINIEVASGATSVVTLTFNASIIDPTINFSDIEAWTTLDFGMNSFAVTGQSANLVASGNTVNAVGFDLILGDEAAGSLKFTGSFTSLQFSIINDGSGMEEDRTAFVVSTMNNIPEPSSSTILLVGLGAIICRRRR